MPYQRASHRLRASVSLAALLLGLLPAVALADAVSLRAGERGSGARVVFDWPAPVTHAVRVQDNSVRLSFARPLEADISALRARVPAWVRSATLSSDRQTLTLNLNKAASAQSFVSGNKVVLDLMPARAAPPKATEKKAEKKPERPALKVAERTPPPVAKPEVKPEVRAEARLAPAPEPIKPEPVKPEPAQVEAAAPVIPPAENVPAPDGTPPVAAAPEVLPEPVQETAAVTAKPPVAPAHDAAHSAAPPADAGQEAAVAASAPPAAQTETIPATTNAPLPPVTPAPPVASVSREVLPPEAAAIELKVASTIPLAVFMRGNALYVAVNEATAPRVLDQWLDQANLPAGSVQLIKGQGGRVLRITRQPADLPLYPVANGSSWRLSGKPPLPAPAALEVIPEPAYALGPRVLVKTEAAANPVFFADPVVGDTLVAVPVAQSPAAVRERHQFVQADIMPSLQGVALRIRSEDLSVISSPMGVEISAGSGFKLSELAAQQVQSSVETAAAQPGLPAAPPVIGLPRLFDFREMGAPAGADFTNQRIALQNAIVAAAPEDRNAARLDLARFYFVNGMATEALALYDLVGKTRAEVFNQPTYSMIRAIAGFSSGSADETKAQLTAIGYPSVDLALWRGAAAVRARDWPQATEQFKAAGDRLWEYPNPYRYRLAIAAIEAALNSKDYQLAEMLLGKLQDNLGKFKDSQRAALDYLGGQIAWYQKHPEQARARLASATTSWNNYWRVRAELALTDIDAASSKPDLADLVRRVERLRFAWRGDMLEFDVLQRLARLHLRAEDYANAFDDFAHIAQRFPADPRVPDLKNEQQAAFTRIFQGDDRDRVPAYLQLAIWDRFPEFRPAQPAVLDDVRGYLAERVASMDLLDRSAGFYNEILGGTTDPAQRAKLGTHIAGLWLLDRKADEAMKALTDTNPAGAIPEELRDERRILQARSLSGQGKSDEALNLLTSDYSDAAMRLRADITWQTRRWAEAAAVLDALIGSPPKSGGKLSDEKAAMVLNRATALALADDRSALAAMRVDFGEAMASMPQASTFQLVTRPDVAGGLPDRKTLGSRMAEVDLFQKVLERYRGPPDDEGAQAQPPANASVAQQAPPAGANTH